MTQKSKVDFMVFSGLMWFCVLLVALIYGVACAGEWFSQIQRDAYSWQSYKQAKERHDKEQAEAEARYDQKKLQDECNLWKKTCQRLEIQLIDATTPKEKP